MPENTVVYAALPNLTDTITESHRIIQERMSQNAALREWWEKEQAGRAQNMDRVVESIRQFGPYLGDEIAVSVSMDAQGRTKRSVRACRVEERCWLAGGDPAADREVSRR